VSGAIGFFVILRAPCRLTDPIAGYSCEAKPIPPLNSEQASKGDVSGGLTLIFAVRICSLRTMPIYSGLPMNRIDQDTEQAVRRFLGLIAHRYAIEGAILFGSRARGAHSPDSDADVAVLLKGEPQRSLPIRLDMADSAYDVLFETGINISPTPVWLDEWEHPERHANPALLRNISQEGIWL
jgi:uncharacterized protein